MNEIKEAFKKVKEDFDFLNMEISSLKEDLSKTKEGLVEIGEALYNLNKKTDFLLDRFSKTEKEETQTPLVPFQTNNLLFKPRNNQKQGISMGNGGVQTDRQTDRQTDGQREEKGKIGYFKDQNSFEEFSGLLDSLDGLKKEIRLKFKRLTEQELVLFSAIYQMEEEKGFSDYKSLSKKLSLTESSIRDYVRRLIFKGIPLEKKKINNKEIHLFVSESLKKIASLNTILRLIEL